VRIYSTVATSEIQETVKRKTAKMC